MRNRKKGTVHRITHIYQTADRLMEHYCIVLPLKAICPYLTEVYAHVSNKSLSSITSSLDNLNEVNNMEDKHLP